MKPYTYLIGWTKSNKFYYGVRYAKKCDPSELWVSYFTSSEIVKKFRLEYGEPDLIQIRRVFKNSRYARKCEIRVLKHIDINDAKWLNQHIPNEKFYISEKTRSKMSKTWKSKSEFNCDPQKALAVWTGSKHSEESRLKMSISNAKHNSMRSERMKNKNPMKNPKSIEKMLQTRIRNKEALNVSS